MMSFIFLILSFEGLKFIKTLNKTWKSWFILLLIESKNISLLQIFKYSYISISISSAKSRLNADEHYKMSQKNCKQM